MSESANLAVVVGEHQLSLYTRATGMLLKGMDRQPMLISLRPLCTVLEACVTTVDALQDEYGIPEQVALADTLYVRMRPGCTGRRRSVNLTRIQRTP